MSRLPARKQCQRRQEASPEWDMENIQQETGSGQLVWFEFEPERQRLPEASLANAAGVGVLAVMGGLGVIVVGWRRRVLAGGSISCRRCWVLRRCLRRRADWLRPEAAGRWVRSRVRRPLMSFQSICMVWKAVAKPVRRSIPTVRSSSVRSFGSFLPMSSRASQHPMGWYTAAIESCLKCLRDFHASVKFHDVLVPALSRRRALPGSVICANKHGMSDNSHEPQQHTARTFNPHSSTPSPLKSSGATATDRLSDHAQLRPERRF